MEDLRDHRPGPWITLVFVLAIAVPLFYFFGWTVVIGLSGIALTIVVFVGSALLLLGLALIGAVVEKVTSALCRG